MGCTTDPVGMLRRIDSLEADLRRVRRSLARCTPGSGLCRDLEAQAAELHGLLVHLREAVARAEADGFKVWSREDFAPGDFVLFEGTWYEVLRANPRSLTLPYAAPGTGQRVVRAAGAARTWTARYRDGIMGRMGANEMKMHPENRGPKGSRV